MDMNGNDENATYQFLLVAAREMLKEMFIV